MNVEIRLNSGALLWTDDDETAVQRLLTAVVEGQVFHVMDVDVSMPSWEEPSHVDGAYVNPNFVEYVAYSSEEDEEEGW